MLLTIGAFSKDLFVTVLRQLHFEFSCKLFFTLILFLSALQGINKAKTFLSI